MVVMNAHAEWKEPAQDVTDADKALKAHAWRDTSLGARHHALGYTGSTGEFALRET